MFEEPFAVHYGQGHIRYNLTVSLTDQEVNGDDDTARDFVIDAIKTFGEQIYPGYNYDEPDWRDGGEVWFWKKV